MAKENNQYNLPGTNEQGLNNQQSLEVRELISAILSNYEGIVRFRNIETTIVTISDFSSSQHNHSNATNGGQITPSTAFSAVVPANLGGTGVGSLTGIVKGNGTGAFTAVVPLAGTKVYYVSDTSGGAVTRKLTFTDGVLTAET